MRAFGILLLGGVMIVFQFTAEKQKQKEQRKKEIRQMQFDYPQLINKFSLYIGAGMTVRRAWNPAIPLAGNPHTLERKSCDVK